jgi:hypothetical protein
LFQARNKETRNTNLYPEQELMLPPSMPLKQGSFNNFSKNQGVHYLSTEMKKIGGNGWTKEGRMHHKRNVILTTLASTV